MQQRFSTRSYSVRDFEEWDKRGELVLAPKFQRRAVWSPKARSYLMDTIVCGKPIPKIYMRQDVNPKTRRVTREIVDGQQRLFTVLSFLRDGFPILRVHNEEYGGKSFSELDEETQREILQYEFSVDLLQDMPDQDVYDVFARLNSYSAILNPQELRNARYFGEFKTAVYDLANEFSTFWRLHSIFAEDRILRMYEAEFVSELLIAASTGIREKSRRLIDSFYKEHDDEFSGGDALKTRFRETMDAIGGIMGSRLALSKFSEPRLLYPLFCCLYHLQFRLPEMACKRKAFQPSDYPRLRVALDQVEEIFRKLEDEEEKRLRVEAGESEEEVYGAPAGVGVAYGFDPLTAEERKFHDAYSVHWVHAENRRTLALHICRLMVEALG